MSYCTLSPVQIAGGYRDKKGIIRGNGERACPFLEKKPGSKHQLGTWVDIDFGLPVTGNIDLKLNPGQFRSQATRKDINETG